MKLSKSFTLLLLIFSAKNVIAQAQPHCPSSDQIKNVQFVRAFLNPQNDWVVQTAPFKANNVNWTISLVSYLPANDPSKAIADVQIAWQNTEIRGPSVDYPNPTTCYYMADFPANLNWIIAFIN